ncbi:MAG: Fe-S cluster assembly protein IscX [Phycisphaerales bacterium]|jgi:FeS assembly protein IscX|nr:Fe-S cluster assembly protein IscX [Phycisphaeraceae bacterium]
MARSDEFGWLDVEMIAELLAAHHRDVDPLTLRFTALRGLVEKLPGFTPDPDHPVNERILETIQQLWHEERQGISRDDD